MLIWHSERLAQRLGAMWHPISTQVVPLKGVLCLKIFLFLIKLNGSLYFETWNYFKFFNVRLLNLILQVHVELMGAFDQVD